MSIKKCEDCKGTDCKKPDESILCQNCDYCQKLESDEVNRDSAKADRIRQLNSQSNNKAPIRNLMPNNQGRGIQNPMMQMNVQSITVFPTNRCNQACDYCFIYEQARRRGNLDMSEDVGYRVINWLALTSTNPTPAVHWFGGEPLVAYPLIKTLTEYGNMILQGTGRKIRWGMTSNLTLVNDEVSEFLRTNGYNVLCSLDGGKDSHNKHRVFNGTRIGSFDQALAGLKRVFKWQGPDLTTVRWTIAPDTIKDVCKDSIFYYDMGITKIAHEFVYEAEWSQDDLFALESQFVELIPYMVESYKNGKTLDSKPITDGMAAYTTTERLNGKGLRCGLANGSFGVSTTGEIFKCHRFVDQMEHKLGDVFTGLDMAKCGEVNREWNVLNIVPPSEDEMTCTYCPAKIICNAGCLAVNWDMRKSILKPPTSFCHITQMKVRLAGEYRRQLRKANLLDKFFTNPRGSPC